MKGLRIGSYVLICYRERRGHAEEKVDYEGFIEDKRVGWDNRESYVELKDCVRLNQNGEIVAREGKKRLIDAFIDDCEVIDKEDRPLSPQLAAAEGSGGGMDASTASMAGGMPMGMAMVPMMGPGMPMGMPMAMGPGMAMPMAGAMPMQTGMTMGMPMGAAGMPMAMGMPMGMAMPMGMPMAMGMMPMASMNPMADMGMPGGTMPTGCSATPMPGGCLTSVGVPGAGCLDTAASGPAAAGGPAPTLVGNSAASAMPGGCPALSPMPAGLGCQAAPLPGGCPAPAMPGGCASPMVASGCRGPATLGGSPSATVPSGCTAVPGAGCFAKAAPATLVGTMPGTLPGQRGKNLQPARTIVAPTQLPTQSASALSKAAPMAARNRSRSRGR